MWSSHGFPPNFALQRRVALALALLCCYVWGRIVTRGNKILPAIQKREERFRARNSLTPSNVGISKKMLARKKCLMIYFIPRRETLLSSTRELKQEERSKGHSTQRNCSQRAE
jgi:hypothetical protein